jgi:hypothetical protein
MPWSRLGESNPGPTHYEGHPDHMRLAEMNSWLGAMLSMALGISGSSTAFCGLRADQSQFFSRLRRGGACGYLKASTRHVIQAA